MKELTDGKNHAKDPKLEIGDHVLVKQQRKDKLDMPFNPNPYKIVQKKGNMITAKCGDHKITRNSSFFKKISQQCGTMPNNNDIIMDTPVCDKATTSVDTNGDIPEPQTDIAVQQPQTDIAVQQPQTEVAVPQNLTPYVRPQRARRAPKYLDDYVSQ